MKWLLAMVFWLWSSPVAGLDLEVAVGRSEFCCLEDGIWWQSPFGFDGHTRSVSLEVGARKRWGDWSLHGAFVDLGETSGTNTASMRDDDFGRHNVTKPCDQNLQKNCLGYFTARQKVAGVLVGGAYGRVISGVRAEVELGQFFYVSDMSVSIWCPNCGLGHRYAFGGGGTFSSASGVRKTPYIALRATYRGVTLTYRRFQSVDGSGSGEGVEAQFSTGLTNGPVNQVMLGVSF